MMRYRLNHSQQPQTQAGFTRPSLGTAGFTISALRQQGYRPAAAEQRQPRSAQTSLRSEGFTIVELMIATLVFSMILIIITVGVIRFTNAYYKGVNSSATQVAAQNVVDIVSQAVQFSSGGTVGTDTSPTGVFCAGSKVFLYSSGVQYTGGTPAATNWGLYVLPNPSAACAVPGVTTGGVELLSKNMRVISPSLLVTASPLGQGQVWSFGIKVAYGDDDLFCSPGVSGSCASSATMSAANLQRSDVTCKAQVGSQFCSIANLTTVIQQRIVP